MRKHHAIRTASSLLAVVVTGLVAYQVGRADAAPAKVRPEPPQACPAPTAQACMPVWFAGKPGDMSHARKRACPRSTK